MIDVLTIGETMSLVTPATRGSLESAPEFVVRTAGAESNVAIGIAGLGHSAAWASRLGNDSLGRRVLAHVRSAGVDVGAVVLADGERTGVMFKGADGNESEVIYYRGDSAASRLSVADIPDSPAAVIHLTGVTAALSPTAEEVVRSVLVHRIVPAALRSFDVNHRARLWAGRDASQILLPLAAAADILFVGLDEAAVLWGTHEPAAVRALFAHVPTLIVKDAETGATEFAGDVATFVPSLSVTVVDPVGAGDAFAAGWLGGRIRNLDASHRLRLGHICASTALVSVEDQGSLPSARLLDTLLALDDSAWQRLAFDGRWTIEGKELS